VLSLGEFMTSHGNFELLEQELQDAREALRRVAEPLHMREIVELELPTAPTLKALESSLEEKALEFGVPPLRLQKHLSAFLEVETRVGKLTALLEKARLDTAEVAQFCNPRALTKYKLAVARNTIIDLHFLPTCKPFLESASVVILRRVVTCSTDVLRAAQNCLSQRDWALVREQRTTSEFTNTPLKPERLLRLKSPYLESLMFRFGTFFGRVGVRDIERRHLDTLVASNDEI